MEQSIISQVAEKITAQQAGIEGTAPFMVGEQLKDICRADAHAAEIILQDLSVEAMGIKAAEKKIKAYADAHKQGNFACVTPAVAEDILREFYGLPKMDAHAAEVRATATSEPSAKVVNLADFLV